jgi:effector-binding domain-containing protein
VEGEGAKFPEILGAYDALTRWAKEHKREFAASPREMYLSPPGESARWEVVWPLR